MKYGTGTRYTQEIAYLYGRAPCSACHKTVCCVISQTAKSICFLVVRMLQFKTSCSKYHDGAWET